MISRIRVNGRIVYPITSEEGHRHYYDHFNYWRTCVVNTNQVITPTKDEAIEYRNLIAERSKLKPGSGLDVRRKHRKLELYNTRYDWRPVLSGTEGCHGLVSPDGRELLPETFVDIFTQFDAINHPLPFIPVFNGEAWGLASNSSPMVMVSDFVFNSIIPERWDNNMYFVQDKNSLKWGAYATTYPCLNLTNYRLESVPLLQQIMPAIADEILEDELLGDCAPTVFWMTRIGDKVGVLTPFGYSQIIFDEYETLDDEFLFHMIRHNEKSVSTLDYSFSIYN